MCKNEYDITKFEKKEVEMLNELGRKYVKSLEYKEYKQKKQRS